MIEHITQTVKNVRNIMNKEYPQMHELFDRAEQVEEVQRPYVTRSAYWWQEKTLEEAQELALEDITLNEHTFLAEGADVIISWIRTMQAAGVSWQTAYEAIMFKFDVVEERLRRTADMMGNGRTWDENYQQVKGVKKEFDVYTPSISQEDVFEL